VAGLFYWNGLFGGMDSHTMLRNFSKKAIGMILAGTLSAGLVFPGHFLKAAEISSIEASQGTLSQWIDSLEYAESRDSGNAHLKILDHNHKYSYGCLQFQAETFLLYGKLYGLVASDTETIQPLIYNCAIQKELAADMIQGNYENWRQWYNSATKVIGLPPRPDQSVGDNE
jgi:hypothetical protein